MKKTKFLTNVLLIAAMIVGILATPLSAKAAGPTSLIHFIDCGSGNATLLESVDSKGNKVFGLIDGGEQAEFSKKVNPYLTSKLGGNKLKFIVFSHLHTDHAGAIVSIIDTYADKNTTLYFKDVSGSLLKYKGNTGDAEAQRFIDRYQEIRSAATEMGMPVTKIMAATALPSGVKNNNISSTVTPNMLKTKLKPYKKDSSGYTFTGSYLNNITLGEFTLTFFNGQNWNDSFIKKWNENVNSITTYIRCNTSAGKTYSTYLGSDLGGKTINSYMLEISLKAVEALNKEITLLQIPHHAYAGTLNKSIAQKLNFKYAVATTSYDTIFRNPKFTTAEKKGTIESLFESSKFNTSGCLYFTGGSNYGGSPQYALNLVSKITPNNSVQIKLANGNTAFKNGTVVAEMGSTFTMKQ